MDVIEHKPFLGSWPGWGQNLTIDVNATVLTKPGIYYISVYYRSLGGDWIKVSNNEIYYYTSSNYINEIQISATAPPTDIEPAETTSLYVYPNPASDYFYITGLRSNGTVSIYDTNGKLWLTKPVTAPEAYIPINNVPKGVYFIRINDGINVTTKTLIKK
jgi:hypothetical protein